MNCMSQNFCVLHVSNLSVRNIRIFLLMYPGSAVARVVQANGRDQRVSRPEGGTRRRRRRPSDGDRWRRSGRWRHSRRTPDTISAGGRWRWCVSDPSRPALKPTRPRSRTPDGKRRESPANSGTKYWTAQREKKHLC